MPGPAGCAGVTGLPGPALGQPRCPALGPLCCALSPGLWGEAMRPLEHRPGAGADRGQAAPRLVEATVCLGRSARDGVQSVGWRGASRLLRCAAPQCDLRGVWASLTVRALSALPSVGPCSLNLNLSTDEMPCFIPAWLLHRGGREGSRRAAVGGGGPSQAAAGSSTVGGQPMGVLKAEGVGNSDRLLRALSQARRCWRRQCA